MNINELKTQNEKDLQEQIKQAEEKNKVLDATTGIKWLDDLTIYQLSAGGYLSDYALLYRVETESDAHSVLEQLEQHDLLMPLKLHQSGCVGIVTEEETIARPEKYRHGTLIDVGPYKASARRLYPYGTDVKFVCWMKLAGFTAEVTFEVGKPATQIEFEFARTCKGAVKYTGEKPIISGSSINSVLSGIFTDRLRYASSPDYPHFMYYRR